MSSTQSERDEFIRREYGQGRMSAQAIADRLNMPRNSVISRARVLGLSRPKWGEGHKERMANPPRRSGSRVNRAIKNPLSMQVIDRGRPAETQRVIERVAEKSSPKNRVCAWREYEGNGRSLPCCEKAKPGHMWCASHLEQARALKEVG